MQRGFSLVELSIVLVILGLLTGGILAGQSLIRAAELRAVSTEFQRYMAASQTFRDKYMAIPGDFRDAPRFWGDDNAQCPDPAITNGTPGTCGGDNDGWIERGTGASVTGEVFRFWQHLALAGLIEGTYSGNAGTTDSYHAIRGSNIPSSRFSEGTWYVYAGNYTFNNNANIFNGRHGDFFQFGGVITGGTDNALKILTPEETWNIDTKLDDGKPGQGMVIARHWDECTDAATAAAFDANYLVSDKTKQCVIMFRKLFNS